MKIVIDINEDVFARLFDNGTEDYAIANDDLVAIAKSIRKGTPLPKEHRGIVDLKSVQWAFDDAILEEALRTGQVRATHDEIASILKTVPTIINADKAESEDKE